MKNLGFASICWYNQTMTKTLLSVAFLTCLALAPAWAQDSGIRDTSLPPEEQGNASGAGQATGGPASSVFLKGGPINLRAGGYIDHSMDQPEPDVTASVAYEEPKKTSVAAYNAGLIQARAAQQQQTRSAIPSPFPAGWGE